MYKKCIAKIMKPLWKVKDTFDQPLWKVSDVQIVRYTWVFVSVSVSLSLCPSVSVCLCGWCVCVSVDSGWCVLCVVVVEEGGERDEKVRD